MRRRRWRWYATRSGWQPVRAFLNGLSEDDRAEVLAALREVAIEGLRAARHLRGPLYEVRADGLNKTYRVLFAPEGRYGQVLLALDGFSKKTPKTPPAKVRLALSRLTDWRARGAPTQ